MSDKQTEAINSRTVDIDERSTHEMISLMLKEDEQIVSGIAPVIPSIAAAVDQIYRRWVRGGRVFVVGAGTSGRIGMLDAVELGPTFSVDPNRWIAIIAGGKEAMYQPLEENEDDTKKVREELAGYDLTDVDTIIGITASGSTPFVMSAIELGNDKDAFTVSISNNEKTPVSAISRVPIEAVTGPEVIRGSTRLKAGTAQKMILNMISTGVMIKAGKVYQNEMVDMKLINKKLEKRAVSMISKLADIDETKAQDLLGDNENNLKQALFVSLTESTKEEAVYFLEKAEQHLKKAIQLYYQNQK
ncbi:N-acetylmuramic acid 6-phosphate etherase [Fictibacillus barbaricus]|uniref:N-acetylmuramic acid 6-phosphate etherase n=1 Tax=Fictibacillus barbaricus TaxID=182136 RepID=A0ABS2ZCJ5_9BACL|nr:N-acetylmuramic acid 6-phosphate etherase [Fictibacillus barbaricus]MBN3545049.1 N-acetylmuramic acid 6-phosphate etherase [Fictibacillus barbaricus]GGB62134.1 N-acetylmuramic acid 6-phosphate etherase 1 [Fictibacillus barbaricus]